MTSTLLRSTRAVRLLWALLLLAGCPRDRLMGGRCAVDADCANSMTSSLVTGASAAAYRCEQQTGVCYCRTDEACPPSQLCNGLGFCQDRAGCATNADCPDTSLYCDTSAGACVPRGRCTTDLQCNLGEVCDRGQCRMGCRTNGDCNAVSCRCGDVACSCTGTTPAERARCQVGVCDPTFCANDSFCNFGEICGVPPDAGVTEDGGRPRAQCYSDYDIDTRPYCSRCTSGGGVDTCGFGANYCIIDTRTASTYCGADCSEGQQCPRGYGCRDIRIVFTRWMCSASVPCRADPNLPCEQDSDCRLGGSCVKAPGSTSGFCAGQCVLREGSGFGYCSCQADEDCPGQSCTRGECSVSKKRCVNDTDCRQIRCVDFDGIGACQIGQNCTPTAGLTCNEVAPP
ncbi:MAG: hypothetical protein MUC96_10065 [Myxococcaceae bacterium]|jgi:hypothetical protein|nr:hypothetical protein [Myxococcaceae bacterium]